jgi:hypothetical protein
MHTDETTALDIAGPADGSLDLDLDGLPAAVAPPVAGPASALDILTLEQHFIEKGYRLGAPPHVTPRTLALDQAAAEEAGCPECGCHDLDSLPMRRGESYRAVVTCPDCLGEWEA